MIKVSRLVRENLTKRALRFNLVLDDVSITHVAFSPEFTHAVEAKQVLASHLYFFCVFTIITRSHNKQLFEQPSLLTRPSRRSRYANYIFADILALTLCYEVDHSPGAG